MSPVGTNRILVLPYSPRYWVTAREVHLRVANLPKGLLTALRDRHTDLIALEVCHLLFLESLHPVFRRVCGCRDCQGLSELD